MAHPQDASEFYYLLLWHFTRSRKKAGGSLLHPSQLLVGNGRGVLDRMRQTPRHAWARARVRHVEPEPGKLPVPLPNLVLRGLEALRDDGSNVPSRSRAREALSVETAEVGHEALRGILLICKADQGIPVTSVLARTGWRR